MAWRNSLTSCLAFSRMALIANLWEPPRPAHQQRLRSSRLHNLGVYRSRVRLRRLDQSGLKVPWKADAHIPDRFGS